MDLGKNIKKARKDKKMTQQDLAEALTNLENVVAHSTISNWENGTNKPDIMTLFNLCQILDVDANTLLGLDENNSLFENVNKEEYELLFKVFASLTDEQKSQVWEYIDFIKSKK